MSTPLLYRLALIFLLVPLLVGGAVAAPAVAVDPSSQSTSVGVLPGEVEAGLGVCTNQRARLAFSDDASYSGPGPFNAFVLVRNDGGSAASDVVLAFTVIEGGEFFHEAEFGNGQLWWAHGQPDAGIIYFVPDVNAGGNAGVRFVAEMGQGWAPGARTVIRATVASAVCAEPTTDEVLLTFTAAGARVAPTATVAADASRTPTPVATTTSIAATAVSTVLGIEEDPTGAPRPTETAPPSSQILPDGGDGDDDSGTTALLILAFVGVALGFLAVGLFAGRLLPR